MNALDLAKRAYTSPDAPTRTFRGTEYDLFARITHRLKHANTGEAKMSVALVRALHDNRKLWDTLADDVADDANALPFDLRKQIFSMAVFTRQHSSRVMAGTATADVLIDINTAMMKGLRPTPVTAPMLSPVVTQPHILQRAMS